VEDEMNDRVNPVKRVLWLLLPLVSAFTANAAGSDFPNIVYILCDDLGYGDVSCLNPDKGKIPTPHVDTLASQGMIFTDCHSGSSVCTPTRYGLLTGRYAWRTHLQKGVINTADANPLIAEDRLTVGALLKKHGYHTGIVGKWHLSTAQFSRCPQWFVRYRRTDYPRIRLLLRLRTCPIHQNPDRK
jgi:arylsulfatase A-like enzyme